MQLPDSAAIVATVIEPSERPWLDAAADGQFATLHADSVGEVLRAVRKRPVHAVLVAPQCVDPDQLDRLARLVRGFPGVPTVAVLSRHGAAVSERLLELGAHGVRRLVDLSARDGWRRLRELIAHPATPLAARILARVLPALGEPSRDCRHFFEVLVRLAPATPTVRRLADQLRVAPSTFMSRFFRAGLPSPKRYLAATRLLYAAALLETRALSIADVAYRLEYSSPQSFGRHVRSVLGITAGEFRRRVPFRTAVAGYTQRLIAPFRSTFGSFHPLNQRVGDHGHGW